MSLAYAAGPGFHFDDLGLQGLKRRGLPMRSHIAEQGHKTLTAPPQ